MDLESFVRSECDRLHVPGAAVGVRHRGEDQVIAYGITNAEHPLPVDPTTLFQIASITKTFTATALMTFVQSGRIALDDPVVRHLRDLHLGPDVDPESVTVEMLLTHRAGWDGDVLFSTPGNPALSSVPARIGGFRRLFAPGDNWSYNNAAFSVTGCLVEALADEPYAAALRRLVLDPVGISHAFTTADEIVTHRVAAPHAVLGEDAIVLRGFGWQPGWQLSDLDVPAGGIATCVTELLRWGAVALGEIPGPLDDRHRLMMQERRHGAGGNTDSMGLGWLHADLGGVATFGHDGMTVGYISALVVVPSADLVIVVLTNALHGSALCMSVRDHVLQPLAGAGTILPEVPADPPAGVAAELVGSYDDPFYVVHLQPGDGPERLVVEQEQLPAEPGRWTPPAFGDPIPIAWIGADRWMTLEPEGGGAFIDIGRDAGGKVAWIRRSARICPRLN